MTTRKNSELPSDSAGEFTEQVMGIVSNVGNLSDREMVSRAANATGIHNAVLKMVFSNVEDPETLLWYLEHVGQKADVDEVFTWGSKGVLPQSVYDTKAQSKKS